MKKLLAILLAVTMLVTVGALGLGASEVEERIFELEYPESCAMNCRGLWPDYPNFQVDYSGKIIIDHPGNGWTTEFVVRTYCQFSTTTAELCHRDTTYQVQENAGTESCIDRYFNEYIMLTDAYQNSSCSHTAY